MENALLFLRNDAGGWVSLKRTVSFVLGNLKAEEKQMHPLPDTFLLHITYIPDTFMTNYIILLP